MSDTLQIAISGPDGAGKSTLIRALHERLHATGRKVETCSVWDSLARNQIISEAAGIQRYLRQLDPLSRCLFILHGMNASLAAALARRPEILLIDGHHLKYLVSEVPRGLDLRHAQTLLPVCPPIDCGFWLHLSPDEALRRKRGELSAYERHHGDEDDFLRLHRSTRATFEKLRGGANWFVVDAEQPLATVVETIWNTIQRMTESENRADHQFTSRPEFEFPDQTNIIHTIDGTGNL